MDYWMVNFDSHQEATREVLLLAYSCHAACFKLLLALVEVSGVWYYHWKWDFVCALEIQRG